MRFWDVLKKYGQEAGNFLMSNPVGPGPAISGVNNAIQKYRATRKVEDIPQNVLAGMASGIMFGNVPGVKSSAQRLMESGQKAINWMDPENPDKNSMWQRISYDKEGNETELVKTIDEITGFFEGGQKFDLPEAPANEKDNLLMKASKYGYNNLIAPIVNTTFGEAANLGTDIGKSAANPDTKYEDYKSVLAKAGMQLRTLFDPSSKEKLNIDNSPQEKLALVGGLLESALNIYTFGQGSLVKQSIFQAAKGVYGPSAQKEALKIVAKAFGKSGAKIGFGIGAGEGLEAGKEGTVPEQLAQGAVSGVIGGVAGGTLGAAMPYAGYGLNEAGYRSIQGLKKAFDYLNGPEARKVFNMKLKAFMKIPGSKENPLDGTMKAVDDIIPHSESIPDEKTVAQYKKDIEAGNPIEPIKVAQQDGKTIVQDGNQRLEAYKQLGYKEVPTVDVTKPSGGQTYYHGSDNNISGNLTAVPDESLSYGQGVYLTETPEAARGYGKNVYQTSGDLKLKNITEEERQNIVELYGKEQSDYIQKLMGDKDGLRIKNPHSGDYEIVVPDEAKLGSTSLYKQKPRKSMIESLSPEDRAVLESKVQEIKRLQSTVEKYGPDDQVSIDAQARIQELQADIAQNEGTKARLNSMDPNDFHTVMGGKEHANRISQAQEGRLMKDINEAGLADNPPDEQMVDTLNRKGWSFKDADEVAQALIDERNGARITPREHTEAKLNDWLIDEDVYNTEGASQVLTEMQVAEPGFRMAGPDGQTISSKSSFPDWVPESLRKRPLFDAVIKHIQEGTTPKGKAQQELYDVVNAEIRNREGLAAPTESLLNMDIAPKAKAPKRAGLGRIRFSKDIPEGQIELLKVGARDVNPEVTKAIKNDLRKYGKVSRANMEALKDELYSRSKIADTEFAIKDEYLTFKRLEKEYAIAKEDMPDEIRKAWEEKTTDRVLSTVKGNVAPVIERLKQLGVRQEIIDSAKIQGEIKLNSAVRVKRERNGQISTVISKSVLDFIKKNTQGLGDRKNWIKKYSFTNYARLARQGASWLEVPQQMFKRLGLKEVIYDPIRVGERNMATYDRTLKARMKPVFNSINNNEAEQVGLFYATKQGYGKDIEKSGMKPVKYTDLNDKQKAVVGEIEKLKKELSPQIKERAAQMGVDLNLVDWYSPLYTKANLVRVGKIDIMEAADDLVRKAPFFKSIMEREKGVPFHTYEMNVKKTFDAFISGSARFIKLGEKTLPAKYLMESEEFGKIVGQEVQNNVRSWYKQIVSPKQTLHPVEVAIQMIRKAGYRSILGWNPRTVLKQGISLLDVGMIEGMSRENLGTAQRYLKSKGAGSVIERIPDISMADIGSNADKILMGGISFTDKMTAGKALAMVFSKNLKEMGYKEAANSRMKNKILRQALQKSSDAIDLAMGGVTPAQRAKVYNSELGKLVSMFSSTINSRMQYFIEKGNKGIKTGDAKLLAKVATTLFLSTYAEMSITKLALSSGDAATDAKNLLKSALGNIPYIGSVLYAYESGTYHMSPVEQNIEGAITGTAKAVESGESGDILGAAARIAEVMGLPKQIRRSAEGFSEFGGIRETIGGKYIDYDKTQGKSSSGSSVYQSTKPKNSTSGLQPGSYGTSSKKKSGGKLVPGSYNK